VQQAARWLKNRFTQGALILLYHRIVELPSDPYLLCVTPQNFAEHLAILRKQGHPMRLQQLAQALRDGNLPRRAIVVTFDDGYYDNLYNAKPLLERYDIPATVFVTTGYIGHKHEFWWDELDKVLLQAGTLPETLRLSINGSPYQWELGEAAHYSDDDYRCYSCWNVAQQNDPSPRQYLFRSLWHLLHPLSEEERRKALDELLAWAGTESMARSTHLTLSLDEVIQLEEGALVEVGAHTVTHQVLSSLPASAQWDEIGRSKAYLGEILAHPVNSFAYPHGLREHYTTETVAIVRDSGFACACSAFAGIVGRGTDYYQLPRVLIHDWDGDAFARQLWTFFHG